MELECAPSDVPRQGDGCSRSETLCYRKTLSSLVSPRVRSVCVVLACACRQQRGLTWASLSGKWPDTLREL